MRDYYEVLNVGRNATQEEITTAYRKLAKQYHPDMNPDYDTTKKMQEISEAYATLGDANKRRQYDIEHKSRKTVYDRELEEMLRQYASYVDIVQSKMNDYQQKSEEMNDFLKKLRHEQERWKKPDYGWDDEMQSVNRTKIKRKPFWKK